MLASCSSRRVRHRDYFLPPDDGGEDNHAPPPRTVTALISAALLIVALVAVVGLSKVLTPAVEHAVAELGIPKAGGRHRDRGLGVVAGGDGSVARGCRQPVANRVYNLALGSALASIALTIPAVAVVSIALGQPLTLGLDEKSQILLALTLVVGIITLGTGRTTVLQGMVHLVITRCIPVSQCHPLIPAQITGTHACDHPSRCSTSRPWWLPR